MTRIAEMAGAYLAGVDQLRQAVAGLSREQLLARPIPGKWSTLEVVCHLADFEPVLFRRINKKASPSLDAYRADGGYKALEKAQEVAHHIGLNLGDSLCNTRANLDTLDLAERAVALAE